MSFNIMYTSPVKGTENPGYSKIYRFDKHNEYITNFPEKTINNLWESFQCGKEKSGESHPCVGTRKLLPDGSRGSYEWKTFGKMESEIKNLASGLLLSDAVPIIEFPTEPKFKKLKFIGLYSKNREEWLITDIAASLLGAAVVPLYDTLGPDSTVFILNQTKLSTVCGSIECLTKLVEIIDKCPSLKLLVSFDKIPQDVKDKLSGTNVTICKYSEIIKNGKNNPQEYKQMSGYDDLATICYTSGTTGMPKGVLLCHSNFISTMAAAVEGPLKWPGIEISSSDKHISYLPLAHVFERIFIHVCINRGCKVGFYAGDTLKLLDDIKLLQPTVFISVPRLFGRINDKVALGVKEKNALSQWIFHRGLRAKLDRVRKSGVATDMFWDGLAFKKTKALMGGKVRYMINGGAPLDVEIQENMSAFFCVPVVSGYGMTETTAASWIACPGDPTAGHVGAVFPCLEYKLASVPDMNYDAETETPKGEVMARGPAIFHGYFLNPEETKAVLHEDGWFHTGDIAEQNPKTGSLRIIDRKKNIFKLSQGEYVAPEKIEGVYSVANVVSQIFVTGYSTQSFLVGIVVPDESQAQKWGAQNAMPNASVSEICGNEKFKAFVKAQLDEAATCGQLHGYEKVKDFELEHDPFSVENNLLTPTFKLRRKPAEDKYQSQIYQMYQRNS